MNNVTERKVCTFEFYLLDEIIFKLLNKKEFTPLSPMTTLKKYCPHDMIPSVADIINHLNTITPFRENYPVRLSLCR